MKIDLYTKVILTGIFACLCLILLRDVRLEKTAEAGNLNAKIVDVRIRGIDEGPYRWEALPVKIVK